MTNFYVKTDGTWVLGSWEGFTPGTYRKSTNAVTGQITLENNYKSGLGVGPLLPTEFCDEAGVAYADLAALKTATDSFFVKASVVGGYTGTIVSLNDVTYSVVNGLIMAGDGELLSNEAGDVLVTNETGEPLTLN